MARPDEPRRGQGTLTLTLALALALTLTLTLALALALALTLTLTLTLTPTLTLALTLTLNPIQRFGNALGHPDLLAVFTSNYALHPVACAALETSATFRGLRTVRANSTRCLWYVRV